MRKFFCSLCFLMFFFALSTTALAVPDVTAYNNFFSGVSVYTTAPSSLETTSVHKGYYPLTSNEYYVNTYLVNCFNNEFMSGSNPSTYVNGLNLDYITGKSVVVPSGNCLVVYSKSGQNPLLYIQGQCDYMHLGTTNLVSDVSSVYGDKKNFSDNVAYSGFFSSGTKGNTFDRFPTTVTNVYLPFKSVIDSTLDLSKYDNVNSCNYSMVYYIYNSSSSNLYLSTGSYVDLSEIPVYDFETTSFSDVSYVFSYDNYSSSDSLEPSGSGISFYFPCINDNLDIYTLSYANRGRKNLSSYYNIGYSSNVLLKNPSYYSTSSFKGYKFDFDISNIQYGYGSCKLPVNDTYFDYAPIFLNDLHGQYKYAVRVNGGYVDISNYDELIQKLKDAGFGSDGGSSADLDRIISILDDINTGGVTGENAKALIDALEQSHQPIVDNGNTGWNSTKEMFEAYKQLFDFSGSSLHWIVVANNALFNIFSGIIMMCCVFIVFGRVFKS